MKGALYMEISNNFPILQKSNAIFIVSGKLAAKIYRIGDGLLHERDTLEVTIPRYTDREGYYEQHSPQGSIQGSGSMGEVHDDYIQRDFIKYLADEIKDIKRPYDSVYVFGPAHVVKSLEQALPRATVAKIRQTFVGNFTKQHPTELLEKIESEITEKNEEVATTHDSAEVTKILNLKLS
jgi:hypothetical protein